MTVNCSKDKIMKKEKALDIVASILASRMADHEEAARKNENLRNNTDNAKNTCKEVAAALGIEHKTSVRYRHLMS